MAWLTWSAPAPPDERVVVQQLGRGSQVVGLEDRVALGRTLGDAGRDTLARDHSGAAERGTGIDQGGTELVDPGHEWGHRLLFLLLVPRAPEPR
jgi:hypothetical protein